MKPKCTTCKKVHNPKRKNGNYGWHINKFGYIEKCSYQVLEMRIVSRKIRIK